MDLILLIGQSNAKGCGNPEESERPDGHGWEYVENFTGHALIPLSVTLQHSEGRGTIAPAFARGYHESTGEDVCIIHYAVDGSRIKNWLHDQNHFLLEAMEKFKHAQAYISEKTVIGRKAAIWIQGESDGKYGTDPLYYKEKLIQIGRTLKEECGIDHTFVSKTGRWLPNAENLERCRGISEAQEQACREEETLVMAGRMADFFEEQGLLQDEVHYCMKALNMLGREIAENIGLYYNKQDGMCIKTADKGEDMKKYVSIDIGGTAIKYGLVSEAGEILSRQEMKTEAYKGGPVVLAKAAAIVEELIKEGPVSGICISTAGMVDTIKGEIFYAAPLIPEYAGTKFKQVMEETFHLPCEAENDVNCAGLAETVSGAAKGSKSVLMLTIGTGIGGCIVLDDAVYHGFSNSACEVGYMHMFDSDFQTLGAASILTKKVAERKGEPEETWNGYRIFEEAKSGDAVCIGAIDEMADVLGRGIANICYVINPETVVLGGGIMAQEEYLKGRIEAAVARYLIPSVAKHTSLRFAKHKNDAGMLGAFYHFMGKHKTVR